MPNDDTKPAWPYNHICRMSFHRAKRRWFRKYNGKQVYFGGVGEEHEVLKKWLAYEQARQAERPAPLPDRQGVTVNLMVNMFLHAAKERVKGGELSAKQFLRYQRYGAFVVQHLGRHTPVATLNPFDFTALRKKITGGPVNHGNWIRGVRTMFRWGREHYDVGPRYGDQFKPPAKAAIRKAKRKKKTFTREEILWLLLHASPVMEAMILLAINCGFGERDCALLPAGAIQGSVLRFERPKTGVDRVCWLWPETLGALTEYRRPSPARPDLFFVTRFGREWVKDLVATDDAGTVRKATYSSSVHTEFAKLCRRAGIAYRGFYSLRHTFGTVADGAGDTSAKRAIMGHVFEGMDDFYNHLRDTEIHRIERASNHVRAWLFTRTEAPPAEAPAAWGSARGPTV